MNKPKTEYYDGSGKLIPPENFDDDWAPGPVDKTPGGPYDRLKKELDEKLKDKK